MVSRHHREWYHVLLRVCPDIHSGIETISHIYDNGRITLMFCSFGPNPQIVRLFGRGTVYEVSRSMSSNADVVWIERV